MKNKTKSQINCSPETLYNSIHTLVKKLISLNSLLITYSPLENTHTCIHASFFN